MARRFSLRTLLLLVSIAGVGYSGWRASHRNEAQILRALECRLNQNLIDRTITNWEHQHGWLKPDRGDLTLDLDSSGCVVFVSGNVVRQMDSAVRPELRLAAGSLALADAAPDRDMFTCPEAPPEELPASTRGGARYRWVFSAGPLSELGGRSRGVVCLMHGARPPSGNLEARHAR